MVRVMTWASVAAGTVIVGAVVIRYMPDAGDWFNSRPEPVIIEQSSIPVPALSNPLLTADKRTLRRWFHGYCFAEIYNKEPSYGGKAVPGCIVNVLREVNEDTGYPLTETELLSPEVMGHMKQVYGNGPQWRR